VPSGRRFRFTSGAGPSGKGSKLNALRAHRPEKSGNGALGSALAAGLLFVGQGLGYIRWPASSFMISQVRWVYYGGGIALAGLILIVLALTRSNR
jgi:hypothetical protein